MKLNGIELEFDFYDADIMERFECSLDESQELIHNFEKEGLKQSEMITRVCRITGDMLDDVWGEGTAEQVFEGKRNFRLCIDIFKAIVAQRHRQEEEMRAEIDGLGAGLGMDEVSQNRVSRRNKKYK